MQLAANQLRVIGLIRSALYLLDVGLGADDIAYTSYSRTVKL